MRIGSLPPASAGGGRLVRTSASRADLASSERIPRRELRGGGAGGLSLLAAHRFEWPMREPNHSTAREHEPSLFGCAGTRRRSNGPDVPVRKSRHVIQLAVADVERVWAADEPPSPTGPVQRQRPPPGRRTRTLVVERANCDLVGESTVPGDDSQMNVWKLRLPSWTTAAPPTRASLPRGIAIHRGTEPGPIRCDVCPRSAPSEGRQRRGGLIESSGSKWDRRE